MRDVQLCARANSRDAYEKNRVRSAEAYSARTKRRRLAVPGRLRVAVSPYCTMGPMVDSHCHLADKAFDADRDAVIARAFGAGLTAMVAVADSLEEAGKCRVIAEKHDRVFFTAGVHPHHAKEWADGDADRLKALLGGAKAVGEIGLDYHYDFSPRETQKKIFREQLALAKELELPAVVHCREAIADVRAIVEDVGAGPFVLHCCAEKWTDVEWILERGSFLSFTGIATFPKSADIHETIRNCPLEAMMIETDAPYLAPIPHRGKRCEPAHVLDTAKFIAAEKGVSLQQFDQVTTKTTVEFFAF